MASGMFVPYTLLNPDSALFASGLFSMTTVDSPKFRSNKSGCQAEVDVEVSIPWCDECFPVSASVLGFVIRVYDMLFGCRCV